MYGAGAGGAMAAYSDARLKENILRVGALHDGTPVYSYNYKGIPTPTIGVMAQDIEKIRPDAVIETPSGYKAVDYRKATARSAALDRAFGLAA